jgi:erythromycin esterase-like protein
MQVRAMMRMILLVLVLAVGAAPAARATGDEAALSAAVQDLCGRQVALLGESATHGMGHSTAFKAALVERLVRRCGFRTVLFEASHYDFLALSRALRRGDAAPAMLGSALGGLWNRDAGIQSFLGFLFDQAKSGEVTLGGLDYQLGSAGAFYSLEAMPGELAGWLPEAGRGACRDALRRRMRWEYASAEAYEDAARAQITDCLTRIGQAARTSPRGDARTIALQLVDNAARAIRADGLSDSARANDREAALYANFRRFAARGGKIIVWAATVHLARDAGADPRFAGGRTFGAALSHAYGKRAFVLGFSALGGSYRLNRRETRVLPAAPPGSIEAQAFAGADVDSVYVGAARLAALGRRGAGIFRRDAFTDADWSKAVDAVVVFREEYPPRTPE